MAYVALAIAFLATLTAIFRDFFGAWGRWFSALAIVLAVGAFAVSVWLEIDAQATARLARAQIVKLTEKVDEAGADLEAEIAKQEIERTEQATERMRQDEERKRQIAVQSKQLQAIKLKDCNDQFEHVWSFESAIHSIREETPFVVKDYTWYPTRSSRYREWLASGLDELLALAYALDSSYPNFLSEKLFQHHNTVSPAGIKSVRMQVDRVIRELRTAGCSLEWKGANLGLMAVLD